MTSTAGPEKDANHNALAVLSAPSCIEPSSKILAPLTKLLVQNIGQTNRLTSMLWPNMQGCCGLYPSDECGPTVQRCVIVVVARDGFGQHYTPLHIRLDGLILHPAA